MEACLCLKLSTCFCALKLDYAVQNCTPGKLRNPYEKIDAKYLRSGFLCFLSGNPSRKFMDIRWRKSRLESEPGFLTQGQGLNVAVRFYSGVYIVVHNFINGVLVTIIVIEWCHFFLWGFYVMQVTYMVCQLWWQKKAVRIGHAGIKAIEIWSGHVQQDCIRSSQIKEFFVVAPVTVTRGRPYRLFVNFARHNVRKNFFANRVACKIFQELPAWRCYRSVIC